MPHLAHVLEFTCLIAMFLILIFARQGVVTVGDYDGVVSQMHLESGHFIADIDDHGGSRCVL